MTTFAQLAARGSLVLNDGYRTKVSELGPEGFPILRVAEIADGYVTPSFADFIRPEFDKSIGVKLSQPGDVLLTTKGTVGRRAIMPDLGRQFAYSPQLCFFRVIDSSIDPRWLYYWLAGSDFWLQAAGVAQQTDMAPYISLRDLRAISIDVPPVDQQRAIAAALGVLDDKIESNRRARKLIWDLLSAQWDQLVGDQPAAPLLTILSLAYGKSLPARARVDGDVPVYGSSGITGWHNSHLVEGPAVVVGRKGTVGEVHWSQQRAWPIDTTFYAEPVASYPLLGCFFALRNAGLTGMNSDSAVPGLNRQQALNASAQFPAEPVARRWADDAGPLLDRATSYANECETLETLRDALLPALLSGRIKVSEARETIEETIDAEVPHG